MGSGVQNVRFLRFLIVLGAVVLSLFLYAFYYSSKTLEIPHIRTGAPAVQINFKINSSNDSNPTIAKVAKLTEVKNAWKANVHTNAVRHHRVPTIDVENPLDTLINVADVENALDEHVMRDFQYQQLSDNSLGNNSLLHNQQPLERVANNINKIQESDVLIPTSNMQKFIENADQILKNISGTLLPSKSVDKDLNPIENENSVKNDNRSLIMPDVNKNINSTGNITTIPNKPSSNNVQSVASDPTQGIPTRDIYESGHLDDELNIEHICPDEGNEIQLLILITSAQAHQDARLAIRQTWGHYGTRRDIAILFMLGRSLNDTLNAALTHENLLYGDLIRGQFLDTYNNLTLKTISALEWVDRHCARANYILKTDDDMFINVPKLLSFLEKHSKEKRVIYGRLAKKWKPIRNKKSKYFVSTEQFAAPLFPPFTTGPAYVMSSDIINDLYQRSLQQTYLKLEDVFTTGIVAQQLGIKRVHGNEFLNRRIAFNPCNIRKTISVHMIKSNEQFDLWRKLLDQTTKCK